MAGNVRPASSYGVRHTFTPSWVKETAIIASRGLREPPMGLHLIANLELRHLARGIRRLRQGRRAHRGRAPAALLGGAARRGREGAPRRARAVLPGVRQGPSATAADATSDVAARVPGRARAPRLGSHRNEQGHGPDRASRPTAACDASRWLERPFSCRSEGKAERRQRPGLQTNVRDRGF